MKAWMRVLKRDWYVLLILLAGFVLGACFYPSLPARVPVHWDASGHANGYGSRFTGAFLLPLTSLGMYLLFLVIPAIDPQSRNYRHFRGSYQIVKSLPAVILLIIQICALLAAAGVSVNIGMVSGIVVSALFIGMGAVMGRIRHNYFIGVRTPWTLANEEVWRKTHCFTGPVWMAGGFLNLILTVVSGRMEMIGFLIIMAVLVVLPVGYSYLAFRKIGGEK